MKPPRDISIKAQLVSGIGASSWFTINVEKEYYRIERFSLEGKLECSGLFKVEPNTFDIQSEYKFTYISHCQYCTIIQKNRTFKFSNLEN